MTTWSGACHHSTGPLGKMTFGPHWHHKLCSERCDGADMALPSIRRSNTGKEIRTSTTTSRLLATLSDCIANSSLHDAYMATRTRDLSLSWAANDHISINVRELPQAHRPCRVCIIASTASTTVTVHIRLLRPVLRVVDMYQRTGTTIFSVYPLKVCLTPFFRSVVSLCLHLVWENLRRFNRCPSRRI